MGYYFIRFFFLSSIFMAAIGKSAEQIPNDKYLLQTYIPVLTASPSFCDISDDEAYCSVSLALLWEVPKAGNYCIYFVEQEKFIACWDNNWSGNIELNLETDSDSHFLLTRGRNGTIAAKTKLSVMDAIKQASGANKKRKGIWRIF